MNRKALVGKILTHIYASLFLVFIFIIYLILFNLFKPTVADISDVQGDLYAERVLIDLMQKETEIAGKSMTFQEGLRKDDLRGLTMTSLGNRIFEDLKQGGYSGYEVQIFFDKAGTREAAFFRERDEWGDTKYFQGFSTACWPVVQGDGLDFMELLIIDDDVANQFGDDPYDSFGEGRLRC